MNIAQDLSLNELPKYNKYNDKYLYKCLNKEFNKTIICDSKEFHRIHVLNGMVQNIKNNDIEKLIIAKRIFPEVKLSNAEYLCLSCISLEMFKIVEKDIDNIDNFIISKCIRRTIKLCNLKLLEYILDVYKDVDNLKTLNDFKNYWIIALRCGDIEILKCLKKNFYDVVGNIRNMFLFSDYIVLGKDDKKSLEYVVEIIDDKVCKSDTITVMFYEATEKNYVECFKYLAIKYKIKYECLFGRLLNKSLCQDNLQIYKYMTSDDIIGKEIHEIILEEYKNRYLYMNERKIINWICENRLVNFDNNNIINILIEYCNIKILKCIHEYYGEDKFIERMLPHKNILIKVLLKKCDVKAINFMMKISLITFQNIMEHILKWESGETELKKAIFRCNDEQKSLDMLKCDLILEYIVIDDELIRSLIGKNRVIVLEYLLDVCDFSHNKIKRYFKYSINFEHTEISKLLLNYVDLNNIDNKEYFLLEVSKLGGCNKRILKLIKLLYDNNISDNIIEKSLNYIIYHEENHIEYNVLKWLIGTKYIKYMIKETYNIILTDECRFLKNIEFLEGYGYKSSKNIPHDVIFHNMMLYPVIFELIKNNELKKIIN